MPITKLKKEKIKEPYRTLYGCSVPKENQCPLCETTWKLNHGNEYCPLLELEAEFLGVDWFDDEFIN